MEPSLVDDDRLPHVGDVAILDLPRAVRGGQSTGSCRVTACDGLRIRLESPNLSFPVPAGVPAAVTWGTRPFHLFGTVIAKPGPGVVHLALTPPAQLREHPRIRLDAPALIELFLEGDCPALSAQVIDLSEGGVKVTTGTRLAAGAQVFVSMNIPRVGTVLAVAEVLDCTMPLGQNLYEAGMRFLHISEEHLRPLAAFLAAAAS